MWYNRATKKSEQVEFGSNCTVLSVTQSVLMLLPTLCVYITLLLHCLTMCHHWSLNLFFLSFICLENRALSLIPGLGGWGHCPNPLQEVPEAL